jgi:hypothetical protein
MKLKKNKRERAFQEEAILDGYEVLSKGWPDFLLYKQLTNKAVFVEVKRKQKHVTLKMGLSKHQQRVHEILKNLGLNVKTIYIE